MKILCAALGLCALGSPAFATCNQAPFDVFFTEFSQDIAFQKAVTAEQITLSQLDPEADPEPVAVVRAVSRGDLEWPLVPDMSDFERSGGSLRSEPTETGQSVTLSGDSGYLITLTFLKSPCWQLTAVKDDSM